MGHYLSNLAITGIIQLALVLPYTTRVRFFGALVQRVVGPLVGYKKRALDNLARIRPDLPTSTQNSIASACLNNVGRMFI